MLETLQSIISKDEILKSKNIPIMFIDRLKMSCQDIGVIRKADISKFSDYDILICAPSAYKEIVSDLKELIGQERMQHVFGISEILKNPSPMTHVNMHDWLSGEVLLEKYNFYKNRETLSVKKGGMVLPF